MKGQRLIISLLLSASFLLFAGLTKAVFPDPTILSTVATNGSIFECGTAGAGSCSGYAFNMNATSISKNWSGSYNFLFVFNSTQNQDEWVDNIPVIQAVGRDPSGTTYGVSNLGVQNSTSGIPCNGGGCQTGIEFRGTVDGRVTNITIQFHYKSTFSNTNNNGIINVSLDINDVANRKVILPTPSVYCADNYTLVVTTPQLIFNGTAQQLQNITTIQVCNFGVVCNNQSFFGPACDPPVLQQPFYIITVALFLIIVMAGIVFLLKKVL